MWDHGGSGNYWHDYDGSDMNGDGIGDQSHPVPNSSTDRFPLMTPWYFTPFRLLGTSPFDGEEGVSPDAQIVLTFSTPLDLSKLLDGIESEPEVSLSLRSMSGLNDTWHVVLSVEGGLDDDTTYIITLQSSIKDMFDRNLEGLVTFSFSTRDDTAPVIELISPQNGSLISPGTFVRLRVHDDYPGYLTVTTEDWTLRYDGQDIDVSSGNWSDGEMHLEVVAFDQAGNRGELSLVFFIDGTPPDLISVYPPTGSHIRSGTCIDITGDDTSRFSLTIQTIGIDETGPGPTLQVDTTGWSEGSHHIRITLQDEVGNNADRSFNITIDDTSPRIILIQPTDGVVIGLGTIASLEVHDTALETVTIKIGEAPWSPVEVGKDGTIELELLADTEGLLTLYVSASDLAGNKAICSFTFLFDSGPPMVSTLPDIGGIIPNRTSVLTVTMVDKTLAKVSVSIDGRGLYTGSSAEVTFDLSVLDGGWHELAVYAIDALGQETVFEGEFNLDWDPPVIVIIEPESGHIYNTQSLVRIIIQDENLGRSIIEVDDELTFDSIASNYHVSLSNLTDGVHSVRIHASDSGGNEAFANVTIVVDGTPPTIIPVNFVNRLKLKTRKNLLVGITDINKINAFARLDGGEWIRLWGNSEFIIPFQPSDGVHRIDVMAVDQVNNTAVASFQIEYDMEPEDDDNTWLFIIIGIVLLSSLATVWLIHRSRERERKVI